MSEDEKRALAREIRNLYWHIRTLRRGFEDAPRRRYYRKIEKKKKRLLEAGVSKREVLDLLMCCRSRGCRFRACLDCTQPFVCMILFLAGARCDRVPHHARTTFSSRERAENCSFAGQLRNFVNSSTAVLSMST